MLHKDLYQVSQIKLMEKKVIAELGIDEIELMRHAGKAAFNILQETWPDVQKIIVLCGAGNNGGDGYALARLAHMACLQVELIYFASPGTLQGAAAIAAKEAIAAGVFMTPYAPGQMFLGDVIVDALFGTGLSREVTGDYATAINTCNQTNTPVLSLDISSGLNGDTGHCMGVAMKADVTVTFMAMKQGLATGEAADYCGLIYCDDLAMPDSIRNQINPSLVTLDWESLKSFFSRRLRSSHKGNFGSVLVIGGNVGMPGSVRLAGEAALRAGAGRVTVATHPLHICAVVADRPELMCYGITGKEHIEDHLLLNANVVLIGNGLGQDTWATELFNKTLQSTSPLVVDADGLNLLAQKNSYRDNWILTPHPGEAARLLGISTDEIQKDRFSAIETLQKKFGGVIVLKGAGTLIRGESLITYICQAGNPGMATAGMGDALSGIIAGFLAQGMPLGKAAQAGVFVHALIADEITTQKGERGLLALDVIQQLQKWIN